MGETLRRRRPIAKILVYVLEGNDSQSKSQSLDHLHTRPLTLKHIVVSQVLSALERLLRDEEAEIRITSARTLEQFCADLDEPTRKRIIAQRIIPLLKVDYRSID